MLFSSATAAALCSLAVAPSHYRTTLPDGSAGLEFESVGDDLSDLMQDGSSGGEGGDPSDPDTVFLVHGPGLVALVLVPFLGRFLIDYLFGAARKRCSIEVGPEYKTCLDRPFVQLEIREARAHNKNIITVYEEERRRPAFFDYGLAWDKYGESEWKFVLDIDSVVYRRDREEAEAMLRRILAKAHTAGARAERPAAECINAPGQWDFMVSYTQRSPASEVLAVKIKAELQRRGKAVWLDVDMPKRDQAAMREGALLSQTATRDTSLCMLAGADVPNSIPGPRRGAALALRDRDRLRRPRRPGRGAGVLPAGLLPQGAPVGGGGQGLGPAGRGGGGQGPHHRALRRHPAGPAAPKGALGRSAALISLRPGFVLFFSVLFVFLRASPSP
eukprot:SAG11_NODE_5919_length_1433_cov_1.227886_1_plen_387_part_01